jgi:hypothetical protein
MAHEPKWECLSLTLKRLMASGAAEKDAKRDLCNAIADKKIRLRLRFAWRPTTQDFLTGRDKPDTEIRYVKKVQIPAILKPGDFDWQRSQVRKPALWRKRKIRGPSGSFLGNWRVIEIARYRADDPLPHSQRGGRCLTYQHRVELHSADVTKILIGPAEQDTPDEQERALAQLLPDLGPKTRAIAEIIIELGLKHIMQLPSKKARNKEIIEGLQKKGHKIPAYPERSIQRLLALLRQ